MMLTSEREPADGCDFDANSNSNSNNNNRRSSWRTRGDGAESPQRFTDGHSRRRRRPSPGNSNSNSNSNFNSNSNSPPPANNNKATSGSPSDSTEDLSSLRCSSLQIEAVQRKEAQTQARKARQPTAGYPGLAFGSPMFSNTLFKFNLIANELRDLKINQLKRAEGEMETLTRRLEAIEAVLEKGRESLRLTTVQLEAAHQEAVAEERLRERLEEGPGCLSSGFLGEVTGEEGSSETDEDDERINSYLQSQLTAARLIASQQTSTGVQEDDVKEAMLRMMQGKGV